MVAKIELVFNPAFVNRDNETTLANAVETGKVGSLEVDKDSFKVLGKDAYIIINTHLQDPKETTCICFVIPGLVVKSGNMLLS